jgi:alcohol dehydrogenase
MRNVWEFFSTQRIVFGNGSVNQLNSILNELNAKNVLFITDPGLKKAGIADKVLSLLHENINVAVYDQVVPEPPIEAVMDCYEFTKTQFEMDVVIALGGGSCIDMAKIVALLIAHGGHPLDYFGGENGLPGPISPLIAIPTTSGTGSEVTSVAVLTDVENNLKIGISDNHLRSTVALLDPELTVGLPPYITACSGIDALSHAIEAYTAMPYQYTQTNGKIVFQGSIPVGDALAIEAIKLISENLTLAVQQGSNLEARSNMMLGSLLAGMAFSNVGTAIAHAAAYPVGGLTKSPHGEVTGLLLPYVMEYNVHVQLEKMQNIAKIFGVETEGLSKQEAALHAPKEVLKLLKDIGLPTKLSEIGINKEDIPTIVEKSLEINRLVRNNPRVPYQRDLEELLFKAL